MAEVRTGEFSKYRSNLIDHHRAMMVVLWDTGPERPKPPARPDAPRGKAGDPEYDLAAIEFHDKLEQYEIDLKAYGAAKRDHEIWWRKNGGAVEFQMWSCDARDALEHDANAVSEARQHKRRYYISSKTRGYQHLENRGLPPGIEPGHGQDQNLKRQANDDRALAIARREDPVFGEGAV